MLIAMGAAAFLCVALGVYPQPLYDILPFPVDYEPYTVPHVVNMLQILLFSALAFVFLRRAGLYPPELKSVNLDFDWFYRRFLNKLATEFAELGSRTHSRVMTWMERRMKWFIAEGFRHHGPGWVLARTWPTGSTVLWVAVLLSLYLLVYFL